MSLLRTILSLVVVCQASLAVRAQAQGDLAGRKDFHALRLASTDPNARNGDSRRIPPGGTLELGKISGAGRITHMWFTIAAPSKDHLRELVLRIFWDGAQRPAVACPLGDFFGLGFGEYVEYKSAPIAIGGIKALNCYWPMPFAKGARLTLTNQGSTPVNSCYVDGATRPTIEGTGSEDYFCGAWDFRHAFWNPYSGVPLYDNAQKGGEKRGIRNTCYRWHIPDPVPFKKSLRMSIEHGRSGPNNDRKPLRNYYSSLAYFYLDTPEGDAPALPPYQERIARLLDLP